MQTGPAHITPVDAGFQRASAVPGRRGSSDPAQSVGEMVEESIYLVTGLVVGGPALPGLLFCVPGLIFFIVPAAILLIVPALAIGLLVAVAGLVIVLATVPVRIGWRGAHRVRRSIAGRRMSRPLNLPRRHQPTGPDAVRVLHARSGVDTRGGR